MSRFEVQSHGFGGSKLVGLAVESGRFYGAEYWGTETLNVLPLPTLLLMPILPL